ncbi:hypothetical protein EJB05_43780, partial [Eragrostis curvula]
MLHLQKHLGISFRHQWLLCANRFAATAASKAPTHSAPPPRSSPRLKSPSNPDAVLSFLSGFGLSPSDIASAIAREPKLLRIDVKEVLAPRLAVVQENYGLSTSQIARFVLADPSWFRRSAIISKLQFYVPLFGSFDNLLLALKKSPYLLGVSLERVVKPNVSLLREYGLGPPDISKACLRVPRLLWFRSGKMQAMAASLEEIGVPRGKPMFRIELQYIASLTKECIASKTEMLKKALQCSDAEVMTVLSRAPNLLTISHDKFRRVSRFLISEAGLDPKYVASNPALMTYSLEGRLMPRFYVVKFLKEKGLLGSQRSYYAAVVPKEKDFVERFIHPYKGAAPHLAEDYAAACRGQVPSRLRSQEPRTGLASV